MSDLPESEAVAEGGAAVWAATMPAVESIAAWRAVQVVRARQEMQRAVDGWLIGELPPPWGWEELCNVR